MDLVSEWTRNLKGEETELINLDTKTLLKLRVQKIIYKNKEKI